ncbi:hypothetical protein OMO38_06370 [Chryseobacterium sp. 09-1422]|uniref:Gliding motility protein GldB n=1 Tax=Chryseobacterium kimseyorum TaxID=2984028 RepID=A0ABT3HWI3_9FLAO|nr:hypothetical protein [Chryseobacterium kimseyorum]MCW3168145.1 hypothetical protein [Chryseobacterium kimseyorum]
MIKKPYFFLVSILFFISCRKETEQSLPKRKPVDKTLIQKISLPPVYLDSLKTESEILLHIQNRTTEISELLKNSSAENADEIYENLKKENDSALVLLSKKQTSLLDRYYEFNVYDNETQISTQKFPDDVKKTIEYYEKTGIEFWEVGEGMTELRMFPDYYMKLFKGKLTKDYDRYLEIITEEDQVLFAADAGIIIPWRDVAKRIEVREEFLSVFPVSNLKKRIENELKEYRYAYLVGYDNTQTNEQGKFFPENLKEFKRFIKENPESETSKIIVEMLAYEGNNDELWNFVKKKTGFEW